MNTYNTRSLLRGWNALVVGLLISWLMYAIIIGVVVGYCVRKFIHK